MSNSSVLDRIHRKNKKKVRNTVKKKEPDKTDLKFDEKERKSWKSHQENANFNDRSVLSKNSLVLSDPQVITWRNKDAYVYTVDSRNEQDPRSDLEFVIYIPIDTAVEWLDGSGWGEGSKGGKSGTGKEGDGRGKHDDDERGKKYNGDDDARKKHDDGKDGKPDGKLEGGRGLGSDGSDGRFSNGRAGDKKQKRKPSSDFDSEDDEGDGSKAKKDKTKPDQDQGIGKPTEKKDGKNEDETDEGETDEGKNNGKGKKARKKPGRKKKIIQESDADDEEGTNKKKKKPKSQRDYDELRTRERFSDSSWGPKELYLGSDKGDRGSYRMKPHNVDFHHKVHHNT